MHDAFLNRQDRAAIDRDANGCERLRKGQRGAQELSKVGPMVSVGQWVGIARGQIKGRPFVGFSFSSSNRIWSGISSCRIARALIIVVVCTVGGSILPPHECIERIALPDKGQRGLSRHNDRFFRDAKHGVRADAKGADLVHVRIALGDFLQAIPIGSSKDVAVVAIDDLCDQFFRNCCFKRGEGATTTTATATNGFRANRRCSRSRRSGEMNFGMGRVGVVGILQQFAVDGRSGRVPRQNLINQRALIDFDAL